MADSGVRGLRTGDEKRVEYVIIRGTEKVATDITAFRDELKPFYGVIKYTEEKQRFALLTGVSKFSKESIFSDLNNLKDRTMMPSEATLLGYTHDELKRFFPESLKRIAAANGLTPEGAFEKVVRWYDGYRFHPNYDFAGKTVRRLGISFSSEKRTIVDVKVD